MDIFTGILRQSEEIGIYSQGQVNINGDWTDCNVLIVSNKIKHFEHALFIAKQERLGGYKGLLACPLTYELKVLPNNEGFLLVWGVNNTRICELIISDSIVRYLTSYCNSYSRYQTTSFSIDSSKHRWIWYYKELIPNFMYTSNSIIPFTQSLIFDDYGKPIMNAYIEETLVRNSHKFCSKKQLSLLMVSWNVAGLPPRDVLHDFIKRTSSPDLIFFGLQEICFLGKVWGDTGREFEWVEYLLNLCRQVFMENYTIVNNDSLVGIMNFLLIKTQYFNKLGKVQTKKVKLGLKGYAGNKGAIGTRFELWDSSICIINVHLTPHTERLQERNKGIAEIFRNMKFQNQDSELCIDEHDTIFWLGDFNYRIDLPSGKIKALVLQKEIKQLQKFDQLKRARQGARVLAEYHEGEIEFFPTFKYEIESDQFNFKRNPAWCDRILFKGEARLEFYGSGQGVVYSDHKPVVGVFELGVNCIDDMKKKECLTEIFKDIDDEHHKKMPKVSLNKDKLNFGEVWYKIPAIQQLTIKNIGQSSIDLEILSEKWAICSPETYHLQVNSSVSVQVTIYIDSTFLKPYRTKRESIQKFLRVNIKGGSEYLVELLFELKDTFIGHNCEYLCKMTPSTKNNVIPEVLARIIKHLDYLSIDVDTFLQINGTLEIGETIKNLDENKDWPAPQELSTTNINSSQILQVFWEFIMNLPEPLLDIHIIDSFSQFIESGNINHSIQGIRSLTNQSNWNSLQYILSFILKTLKNSSYQHNDLKLSEKLYKFIYHSDLHQISKHKPRLIFLQSLLKHFKTNPLI